MADDREKNSVIDTRAPSRDASSLDEKVPIDDLELIHGDFKRMDVGLRLVTGHSEEPEVPPGESKRIRRKIDWHLLPLLCIIYTGTLALPARTKPNTPFLFSKQFSSSISEWKPLLRLLP